jgi:hypothetical protein
MAVSTRKRNDRGVCWLALARSSAQRGVTRLQASVDASKQAFTFDVAEAGLDTGLSIRF